MILFNLMFFKDSSNYLRSFNVDSSYVETNVKKTYKSIKKNTGLAYVLKNSEILSESKYSLASKNFVKQSLWQKIFNNLWEQGIFLSVNSKVLNKYDVELNSLNMSQGQNMHKHLVSKFSKSLFEGSVQSSLVYDINNSTNSLLNVEYLWGKILKMKFLSIHSLLQKNEYHENIKKIRNILDKKINLNYVPLFTVSNHLGQMVISEPPTDLNISHYVKSYTPKINQNSNFYHGFFFTSYEDAQEYMLYIQRYYNLDSTRLKIFTCNFRAFYKIVNKFSHEIYFKLVPDLKEVSELIKKYRYHNDLSFYKKQKYTRSSFQGQPLYFVKNGEDYISNDMYNTQKLQKYNLVFTSYNDALQFCDRLQSKIPSFKFKKRNLVVYNLEQFIKDQLSFDIHDQNSYLVVPSKTCYTFTKGDQLIQSSQIAQLRIVEIVSYVKLWTKRIIWSLTSRKP